MTASTSILNGHLSNDLLVRAMDDELIGSEILTVKRHLSACAICSQRQSELRRVSDGLESFLRSVQPVFSDSERQTLSNRLDFATKTTQVSQSGETLARFGWVLAAAATVAVGVSFFPFSKYVPRTSSAVITIAGTSGAGSPFEMDGETFLSLPYSNPDLPLGGAHVVQMQVPLSSLADAGVLLEPTSNRVTMPDRAVLADVLLGMDGQPIGVHVLSD